METDLTLKQYNEDKTGSSKFFTPTLPFLENSVSIMSDFNKNTVILPSSKHIRNSSNNDRVIVEKLPEISTTYQNENLESRIANTIMCTLTHSRPTNKNNQQNKCSKSNLKKTTWLRKISLKALTKPDTIKTIKKSVVTGVVRPTSDVKSGICRGGAKEAIFHSLSSKTKRIRPFKAYPEDPLTVSIGVDTAKLNVNEAESYSEFRNRMLDEELSKLNAINENMGRRQISKKMDPVYLENRKKNNIASKRSRDTRRTKEDELAIRCAYLEQENEYLKAKITEIGATMRD